VSETQVRPPASGLAAMRIGVEFGDADRFAESFALALARGGELGATLVAELDRGDLRIHLPSVDGPCWNAVPLFHLHGGETPTDEDWTNTSATLEMLERYR
jgi:hypothetical protein